MTAVSSLPDVSSADLVLAHPTMEEKKRIWAAHFLHWGRNLTQKDYMAREEYMLSAPMNQNGVFTKWILTTRPSNTAGDAGGEDGSASQRPVFASCEMYRKRAIVRGPDGIVRDVYGYGVGSVFTLPDQRRKGYASKMMSLLRDHMAKLHRESGDSPCSILYSDVGKEFYAKAGWIATESNSYLEFPVTEEPNAVNGVEGSAEPILDEDVPSFAKRDEELLRKDLASNNSQNKTRFAFLPQADVHSWHFLRDDFYYSLAFSRTPTTRGAVYTSASNSPTRVWAIWTGVHYGGDQNPHNNILFINRFVVEDSSISDEELSSAIRAILGVAAREAREWRLTRIQMWNPSERVRSLSAGMGDLGSKFVVREKDSLASLNWFGEEAAENVEWVANERYPWC